MRRSATDDGFSLVEVIVAMFLLALLSLAVLPLLISASRTSVTNRDHVEATSFATAQVAALRADFPLDSATTTCTTLAGRAISASSPLQDPAGTPMTATITVDACPTSGYPRSITVTVTVHDAAGDTAATLPTRIRVARA